MYSYKPRGVCTKQIDFEIENGVLSAVTFRGGCPGNTQGVAALAVGRSVEEVVGKLRGIRCHGKSTSCPDQLASALEQALLQEEKG